MVLVRDIVPPDATVEHLRLEHGDILSVSIPGAVDEGLGAEIAERMPDGVTVVVLAHGQALGALSFRELEYLLRNRPPAGPA